MNKDDVEFVFSFILDDVPHFYLIFSLVCKQWLICSEKWEKYTVEYEKGCRDYGGASMLMTDEDNSIKMFGFYDKENMFNTLLYHAAFFGYEELCKFAKEQGADDFYMMIFIASFVGHENLCRLAKEQWNILTLENINMIFSTATSRGHENLRLLTKLWGAN